MLRDGRPVTVEVTSDGAGLVSHAGTALVAQVADKVGLTNALSAQLSFTDQPDPDIAMLECRHRQHAHVEDRIRDDKDTGLAKFPFKEFALNEVWLEIVALAHDLIVWTQALLLTGDLAKAEPKRIRYRLLHVAGRLAFSGRRAKLHLQDTRPWTAEVLAAFQKLKTLTAATG